jgi:hypothetical protein
MPRRSSFASAGAWGSMLPMAFLLDLRYFGETRPGASPAEIEADLKNHDVDYFIVPGNPRRYPFVSRFVEVKHGASNLHIYQLHPSTTQPTTWRSTQQRP